MMRTWPGVDRLMVEWSVSYFGFPNHFQADGASYFCNDGNPCTTDGCSPFTCGCRHIPRNGASCSGQFFPCEEWRCAGTSCQPLAINEGAVCATENVTCWTAICQGGDCIDIPDDGRGCPDDGDPCTEEECLGGSCTHPPIVCPPSGNPCYHLECDNGLCWGVPDDGVECQDDGNPCTLDVCADFHCTHPCKADCDTCGLGFCIDCECVVCDTSEICCHGTCCEPERCCGGECCATDCEGCISTGSISGGTVTLTPQAPLLDDTMTFRLEGATDTGGVKRVDCNAKTLIPPVTLDYQWILTKPSGATSSGSGAEAPVLADECGQYVCLFNMIAERECPPGPQAISRHEDMFRPRFVWDGRELSTTILRLDLIESAVDAIPIVCEAGFDVEVGGSYSEVKVCCPNGAITPATRFYASGSLSGTASIKWCLPGADGNISWTLPFGLGAGAVGYMVGPFVKTEVGGMSVEVGGTLQTAPCEGGCVTMQYSVPFGFGIGVGAEVTVWIGTPVTGEISAQGSGEIAAQTGGFSVSGAQPLFGSNCGGEPVVLNIGSISAELSFHLELTRNGDEVGDWNATLPIGVLWNGWSYP